MSKEKLEKTTTKKVLEFQDKLSKAYGNYEAENFNYNLFHECKDNCNSPIESLFYSALKFYIQICELENELSNGKNYNVMLFSTQVKIGKYYADFKITLGDYIVDNSEVKVLKEKAIIVELDGHNFHDKDEQQRRYEKQRDRYFQSIGYNVLHFTGKEVTDNAFECVAECIAFLGLDDKKNIIDLFDMSLSYGA